MHQFCFCLFFILHLDNNTCILTKRSAFAIIIDENLLIVNNNNLLLHKAVKVLLILRQWDIIIRNEETNLLMD
jgi:hypothetical protein